MSPRQETGGQTVGLSSRPDGIRGSGGRTPPGARRGRRRSTRAGAYERSARRRLRSFHQGSLLAVTLTAALLTFWPGGDAPGNERDSASPPTTSAASTDEIHTTGAPPQEPGGEAQAESDAGEEGGSSQSTPGPVLPGAEEGESDTVADTLPTDPSVAAREATGTVRDLITAFYGFLPILAIALAILVVAWLVTRVLRPLVRRLLGSWAQADAASALVGILIWLVALGAALSVIAGDARALVGSVGLFGLALSWALQGPIESFTGWLMNSFQGYYRIGDRIAVGEVFGDVYEIDFLTTTVWGAGGPDKPVEGEQPTGALITFPNSDVLRANIVNFTRGFPYVWDEVSINVAIQSDLSYTGQVVQDVADRVLGKAMAEPAIHYKKLLETAGLDLDIATEPHVFFAADESYTTVTARYLIPVRERRRWSSELVIALSEEVRRPEHEGRIVPGFPRTVVQLLERSSE